MSPIAAMIDAHCHLADPAWRDRIEEVQKRSESAGVRQWLQGGVGPEDWAVQRKLVEKRPGQVLPVLGLHPWWVMEQEEATVRKALVDLERELDRGGVFGVGEAGLDHFPRQGQAVLKPALQREAFVAQVGIARKRRLPLVLHVVRAHGEALEVLEEGGPLPAGGLLHAFSGSFEVARKYIQLGLFISVGAGLVGSKGFETLKRSVVRIPADRLVIESDAPDVKDPTWEPARLFEVAQALARFRGETPEAIIERSNGNLRRVFGIQS